MSSARLLIDCDPGLDDAIALVLASQVAEVVGITTVGGNAPLASVTENALLVCQLFGIEAEVHAGALNPLVAEATHAPDVHGESGFGGPELPTLQRRVASNDAVEYLIETIRSEEGLWLVPLGPLTNIALAFRQAPDLPNRLVGVSFMGGSATEGNRTASAEFNMFVDPEAGAIVMGSGARLHMAGLDLTSQFVIDDDLVSSIAALPGQATQLLADLMSAYLDRIETITGARRGALHDPCAVLAVTHPELIESSLRRVDVELRGSETRGMTVVDRRPTPPRGRQLGNGDTAREPNVHHGYQLDHLGARRVVLQALAAGSQASI